MAASDSGGNTQTTSSLEPADRASSALSRKASSPAGEPSKAALAFIVP